MPDMLIWKRSTSGRYTAKQFCLDHNVLGSGKKELWKWLWESNAPPKVQTFCWQLFHDKLAVKDELRKRGLIQDTSALCTLCGSSIETIDNLFFKCLVSWKIWMYLVDCWGLNWVTPDNGLSFFMSWQLAIPQVAVNIQRKAISWSCPPKSVLKFNANGSTLGQPGLAGIENDSSNAIKWVSNPASVRWRMRWIAIQLENLKVQYAYWTIEHIPREVNGIANGLAKFGVHRGVLLWASYQYGVCTNAKRAFHVAFVKVVGGIW
ncbi:hypothetical protein DITRI_Ditri05aG0067000 [Diplodiscus trichospermus]